MGGESLGSTSDYPERLAEPAAEHALPGASVSSTDYIAVDLTIDNAARILGEDWTVFQTPLAAYRRPKKLASIIKEQTRE